MYTKLKGFMNSKIPSCTRVHEVKRCYGSKDLSYNCAHEVERSYERTQKWVIIVYTKLKGFMNANTENMSYNGVHEVESFCELKTPQNLGYTCVHDVERFHELTKHELYLRSRTWKVLWAQQAWVVIVYTQLKGFMSPKNLSYNCVHEVERFYETREETQERKQKKKRSEREIQQN